MVNVHDVVDLTHKHHPEMRGIDRSSLPAVPDRYGHGKILDRSPGNLLFLGTGQPFTADRGKASIVIRPGILVIAVLIGHCSLLGKNKFNELLSGFITKPQGKPTLVPESDKRPALNTAKDDFSEE